MLEDSNSNMSNNSIHELGEVDNFINLASTGLLSTWPAARRRDGSVKGTSPRVESMDIDGIDTKCSRWSL